MSGYPSHDPKDTGRFYVNRLTKWGMGTSSIIIVRYYPLRAKNKYEFKGNSLKAVQQL
jgi:hypothetical protein